MARRATTSEHGVGDDDAFTTTALRSDAFATIAFTDGDGTTHCHAYRFHWNGSEIVICGSRSVPWATEAPPLVAVSIGPITVDGEVEARHLEIDGHVVIDTVIGCAPEFRAAAVRYLGAEAGNALSDEVSETSTMNRMFISPVLEPPGSIDLRT